MESDKFFEAVYTMFQMCSLDILAAFAEIGYISRKYLSFTGIISETIKIRSKELTESVMFTMFRGRKLIEKDCIPEEIKKIKWIFDAKSITAKVLAMI